MSTEIFHEKKYRISDRFLLAWFLYLYKVRNNKNINNCSAINYKTVFNATSNEY